MMIIVEHSGAALMDSHHDFAVQEGSASIHHQATVT